MVIFEMTSSHASVLFLLISDTALAKSKSPSVRLTPTVFWPDDRHAGQTLPGIDLDNNPLQSGPGANRRRACTLQALLLSVV